MQPTNFLKSFPLGMNKENAQTEPTEVFISYRNFLRAKNFRSTFYSYTPSNIEMAQSAGAAEYTDYISFKMLDPLNECSGYDTKQSDSEASVMLELWGTRITPLLPSLPFPLWPVVVAPDRVLFMSQIELFDI